MSYVLQTPVIGGQQAYIDVDDSYAGLPAPALVYFHGATENGSEISSGANGKTGMVAAFRAQRWINCGIAAYGDAWGNVPSLESYLALIAFVQTNFNVSDLLFFSQSMGGIPALLTIASGAVVAKGWAGVSPACSLRSIWNGGGSLRTQIETAYGISPPGDLTSYLAQTVGHDPLLLDAASYSATPLRFYASPNDTTVPMASHSTSMRDAIKATSTFKNVIRLGITDHTGLDQFQPPDTVNFFLDCMAGKAPRRLGPRYFT